MVLLLVVVCVRGGGGGGGGGGGEGRIIMTTNVRVRLCLSYNHFRFDIITFKVDSCSTENAVVMDVVIMLFATSGVGVVEGVG